METGTKVALGGLTVAAIGGGLIWYVNSRRMGTLPLECIWWGYLGEAANIPHLHTFSVRIKNTSPDESVTFEAYLIVGRDAAAFSQERLTLTMNPGEEVIMDFECFIGEQGSLAVLFKAVSLDFRRKAEITLGTITI